MNSNNINAFSSREEMPTKIIIPDGFNFCALNEAQFNNARLEDQMMSVIAAVDFLRLPVEINGTSFLFNFSKLKNAYKKRCRKYHPNKGIEIMLNLSRAWNCISRAMDSVLIVANEKECIELHEGVHRWRQIIRFYQQFKATMKNESRAMGANIRGDYEREIWARIECERKEKARKEEEECLKTARMEFVRMERARREEARKERVSKEEEAAKKKEE